VSSPPVFVSRHAIERLARRSGVTRHPREACALLRAAVEEGEWTPLPEARKSAVRLVTDGRELHAIVVEDDDGAIYVVTVLTPGQLAGHLIDPDRRLRMLSR
jgi:hypothetical protein